MSTISIADLQPTGTSLFTDSESYLKELTEDNQIRGGDGLTIAQMPPTKGDEGNLWSWCLSEPPKSYHLPIPGKI